MLSDKGDSSELREPLLPAEEARAAPEPVPATPPVTDPPGPQSSVDQSEDSEQEPEAPAPAPKKEKAASKDPPKSCFAELKDFLAARYDRMIFTDMNKFFREDCKKVVDSLPPLRADMQVPHHIKTFEEKWREIAAESLDKPLREDKALLDELAQNVHRPVQLMQIIRRSIKTDFLWSVFFSVLSQIANILLPYIMKEYLKDIRSFKNVSVFESVGWCFVAAAMTFLRNIWAQLSARWNSPARIRTLEMLRDNIYVHLADSNVDFLSAATTSFLSKLLLYETDPIENFVAAMINLFAAPVPIVFAATMIYLEFETNVTLALIILALFLVLTVLIIVLHRTTIHLKKKFRTLGSRCTGEVDELTSEARYIRANNLQKHILRQIWRFRSSQVKLLRTINSYAALFNFLFSTPVIVLSLLLLAVQNSDKEGSFDAVTVFSIISAVGSLLTILNSLSDALSKFQDFKPAYELFNLFFNQVARSPKLATFEKQVVGPPQEGLPSVKQAYKVQYPSTMEKQEALQSLQAMLSQDPQDFQIRFSKCGFVDRRKKVRDFLDVIHNEDFMGETTVFENHNNKPVPSLREVDVLIRKGKKICVMGEEASGHQIFLDSLSNEHELLSGLLVSVGQVAHFDAKRFSLLEVSILENIILDRELVRKRLEKICTALELPLDRFVGGERGTLKDNPNITEMLKLKILLARALYSKFELFVFSNFFDSLALDEKVDMFDKTVRGHLGLATVVFHSNDKALADRADWVLVFEAGGIAEQGPPRELASKRASLYLGLALAQKAVQGNLKVMKSRLELRRHKRRPPLFDIQEPQRQAVLAVHKKQLASRFLTIAFTLLLFKRLAKRKKVAREIQKQDKSRDVLLVQSMWETVMKFLKTHTRCTPFLFVLFSLISGLLVLAFDSWLGFWSSTRRKNSPTTNRRYFWILIFLSIGSGAYNLLRDVLYSWMMSSVSNSLFFGSVKRISRADIGWFERMTVPLVIYSITNYQIIMDDDFSAKVILISNNLVMICFAFLIANICFPGFFIAVSGLIIYYMFYCVRCVFRTLEISLPRNFAGRIEWFNCYTTCLKHAASMRYINLPRYLLKGFEKAVWKVEAHRPIQNNTSGRYLGFRAAVMSTFLIFAVYMCPVFIYHTRIYDYSSRLWILSIALLWAGRLSNYISSFTSNIVSLLINVEGGERLWQLQTEDLDPVELQASQGNQARTFLLEEDQKVSTRLTFSPEAPPISARFIEVLEMKSVSLRNGKHVLLSDICIEVDREDKVALMQQKGQSVNILFDLLLGFTQIPKEQRDCAPEWTFKFFEKNIDSIDHKSLRNEIVYLTADPPLFSGTWRDNVDPNRLFREADIIAVLCALDFDKEYEDAKALQATGINQGATMVGPKRVYTMRQQIFRQQTKQGRKSKTLPTAAIQEDDDEDDLFLDSKSFEKCKKFIFAVKICLLVNQWKKFAVKTSDKKREDQLLEQDLEEMGGDELRLTDSSHLLLKKNHKASIINFLPTSDPKSRAKIEKLLGTEIDRQSSSTFLKRIVALARALLIQPHLVIAEENSFVTSLDQGKVARILDTTFAVLHASTILCKITSFTLVHRFTKCAIFDETRIKRYGFAEDIMRDLNDAAGFGRASTSKQST